MQSLLISLALRLLAGIPLDRLVATLYDLLERKLARALDSAGIPSKAQVLDQVREVLTALKELHGIAPTLTDIEQLAAALADYLRDKRVLIAELRELRERDAAKGGGAQ